MAKANEIKTRIGQLEADLQKQHGAVSKAEDALAETYAAGKPADAALEALWRARAAAENMTRALSALDRIWYETATAEYEAAMTKINDETEARYTEAKTALETAVSSSLVPVMKKHGVPAGGRLLEDFTEGTRQLAWEIFSAQAADRQREIGPRPLAPLPRNAAGVPTEAKDPARKEF